MKWTKEIVAATLFGAAIGSFSNLWITILNPLAALFIAVGLGLCSLAAAIRVTWAEQDRRRGE